MKTDRSATLVIPILGHPVAQVATPSLWNAVFAARGQDAVCVPFDLPPEGLEPFYDWVRLADNVPGFLTTIPHKAALATVCDELGAAAQFLGAANTVRKLPNGGFGGDMFDGHGMLDAIAATGTDIAGRHVVICGAGAAGSAIALEALSRGAAAMTILDHDPDRAATVAHRLGKTTGVTPSTALSDAPAQDGILINASPAGSPGHGAPAFLRGTGRGRGMRGRCPDRSGANRAHRPRATAWPCDGNRSRDGRLSSQPHARVSRPRPHGLNRPHSGSNRRLARCHGTSHGALSNPPGEVIRRT